MKLHDLSLATRITIGALAIVVAGAAMLLFAESARLHKVYLNERRVHLEQDIDTETLRLNQAINTLRQDVLFLSNTPAVSGIVHAALNHGYDPRYGNTHQVWAERLQQVFSAFSTAHPDYYRVRFIGLADGGREIVRIDNRGEKIEVASEDKLQAKGGRDYFKATLGLHDGQVYLSEFNLNQESGVIEQAYRPTLRAVTPVFTPSGEMFGMMVISMDVSNLLKSAVSHLPGVQTYMANESGQYLLHPDTQQAFKFDLGSKDNITTDFPFIKMMFDLQAPDYLPLQAITTKPDNPLFTTRRIRFDPSNPSRFLLLMHYLPGAEVAEQIATIPVNTLFYDFMAMLLIAGMATLVLRRTFSPLKQITVAADKITAGEQNIQLPQAGGGEIGSLTNALNSMLTRLSQREKSLRESESRLSFLVSNSTVTIYTSSPTSPFGATYISPNVMMIYGYKPEQFTEHSEFWAENLHPEDRKRIFDGLPQLFEHGVYQHEYRFRISDGNYRWMHDEMCLIRNEAGEATEIIGYWVDITERRQTEERHRTLIEAISSAGIMLFLVDDAYRVRYMNRPMIDAFGNAVGKICYKGVGGAESPCPYCRLSDVISNNKTVHYQTTISDGRTFDIIAVPYVDTDGECCKLEVIHDITERRHAEVLARNSALRHQLLFESSRDALMMLAPPSWKFTGANQATLKLFGASSMAEFTALAPWEVSPVCQPDGRPSNEKAQEMIAIAMHEGSHFFEWVHQRLNGQPFAADVLLTRMDVWGELFLQATVRDITERKQAEELLHKSSEEIEDLYNHAPCGYHSLDKDGVIIMINDTELAWLGYTRDEVIGKMKWPDLLTSASLKIFKEDYPRLMKQGFIHDIEIEIIRKDGTTFTGLINATAIYSSGNYVMNRATVTDITGRKRVERQLHDLTAHLQSVREEEKATIAREIHDDLGGTLTALKMKTHWLKTELSANNKTTPILDHINEMSQLIDNAMGVMRHVVTGLRPSILDDLGLLAALEWQATQFHKHTGIECQVNCVCDQSEDCAKELDKPRSIALFRIAQEALTNVARHSGASEVEIEFLRNEDEIVLSIIDNGCGITENRTDDLMTYGLRGMCERVDQLGGKINFDTPPGGGFNVTVILPLPGNEEEKT